MAKPGINTYPAMFASYIDKVPEHDLLSAFLSQQTIVDHFFNEIESSKRSYAYAPGKWTLKELLQHIIDTERIFNYRALCFARQETASLPGFDENLYVKNAYVENREWDALCHELQSVRLSTTYLYQSFTEDMLHYVGHANERPATALALGFATIGHLYHHVSVVKERYL